MASIFVAVVAVVSSAIVLISLAANSFDTQNAAAASSVVIGGALPSPQPAAHLAVLKWCHSHGPLAVNKAA